METNAVQILFMWSVTKENRHRVLKKQIVKHLDQKLNLLKGSQYLVTLYCFLEDFHSNLNHHFLFYGFYPNHMGFICRYFVIQFY